MASNASSSEFLISNNQQGASTDWINEAFKAHYNHYVYTDFNDCAYYYVDYARRRRDCVGCTAGKTDYYLRLTDRIAIPFCTWCTWCLNYKYPNHLSQLIDYVLAKYQRPIFLTELGKLITLSDSMKAKKVPTYNLFLRKTITDPLQKLTENPPMSPALNPPMSPALNPQMSPELNPPMSPELNRGASSVDEQVLSQAIRNFKRSFLLALEQLENEILQI